MQRLHALAPGSCSQRSWKLCESDEMPNGTAFVLQLLINLSHRHRFCLTDSCYLFTSSSPSSLSLPPSFCQPLSRCLRNINGTDCAADWNEDERSKRTWVNFAADVLSELSCRPTNNMLQRVRHRKESLHYYELYRPHTLLKHCRSSLFRSPYVYVYIYIYIYIYIHTVLNYSDYSSVAQWLMTTHCLLVNRIDKIIPQLVVHDIYFDGKLLFRFVLLVTSSLSRYRQLVRDTERPKHIYIL